MLTRSGNDLGDADEVRLLTIEEVASLLHLGKTITTRLVNSGAIDSVRVGRSLRVALHDVRDFIERFKVSRTDGNHRYLRIDPSRLKPPEKTDTTDHRTVMSADENGTEHVFDLPLS